MEKITIPPLPDIALAVEMFYSKNDLCRKDICRLFGCGTTKAQALKRIAQERMLERGIMMRHSQYVQTDAAYESWGIDIERLEMRLKKITTLREKGLI